MESMKVLQKWWGYLLSTVVAINSLCLGRTLSLESSNVTIRIPSKFTSNKEQYVCTSTFLPRGNFYITSYTPLVSSKRVHHLILFACREPDDDITFGNCGTVCDNSKSTILYAWGQQASPLILPPNSGFDVGTDADLYSLVLQIHYLEGEKEINESNGVTVHMVTQPPHYKVSIFLLVASLGEIPPHKKNVALNISCKFTNEEPIHPFAFRVHSHELGRSVVAYTKSHKTRKIQEIGRANPKWPQSFFPTKGQLRVERNDWLMARCTYDSSQRSTLTRIGSHHHDEMCNFYLMYYQLRDGDRYGPPSVHQEMCADDELDISSVDRLPKQTDLPETIPPGFFFDRNLDMEPLDKGVKVESGWKIDASMGQVSGLALDEKRRQLLVFHRGSHTWERNTFDGNYMMRDPHLVPESTILHVDIDSGKVKQRWGDKMFRLPHGVHVSSYNEKSGGDSAAQMIWVTDVGAHVVMGFTYGDWKAPTIILGTLNEPGNDEGHFCQPADVSTNKKGEIFVADGYCNSRIVKFSPTGKYIKSWESTQGQFMVVHSLIILHELEWICAADRERAAIECFDFDGSFKKRISSSNGRLGSSLFAIGWDSMNRRIFGASIMADSPSPEKAFGFIIPVPHNISGWAKSEVNDMDFVIHYWGTKELVAPHALALSNDGKTLFVAQLSHTKVFKFHVLLDSTDGSVSQKQASSLMKSLRRLNRETSVLVGILVAIPLVLVALSVIFMRYFRCSGCLGQLSSFKKVVLVGRKVNGYDYHRNGHGNTRHRKTSANRNRRLDKGPSFHPLRQDESDMEETVGLNLPQSSDPDASGLLSPREA